MKIEYSILNIEQLRGLLLSLHLHHSKNVLVLILDFEIQTSLWNEKFRGDKLCRSSASKYDNSKSGLLLAMLF